MKNGNQPAFAQDYDMYANDKATYNPIGLTKREYFAGLAMQGCLANPNRLIGFRLDEVAEIAIKLSDALIEELDKPTKTN